MDKNSNKKKGGLGRGLSAILRDNDTLGRDLEHESSDVAPVSVVGSIAQIPVAAIETNPYQPRTEFEAVALKELSESIKVQGIIQPITVRQMSEGHYQLISGERRLQASKLANLSTIPAYIRTANDQQMLEMALIENIQRENLNPMEIALSYQRLISEINLRQEDLGDRVGKDRSTVNNYLRLLRLPPDIQAGLRDKKISMGHARALVSLEQIDVQLAMYQRILEQELSVRKVEDMVRKYHADKQDTPAKPAPTSNMSTAHQLQLLRVQNKLSTQFGTRIIIKDGPNSSGEIKIPFASTEDLNRILEILQYED